MVGFETWEEVSCFVEIPLGLVISKYYLASSAHIWRKWMHQIIRKMLFLECYTPKKRGLMTFGTLRFAIFTKWTTGFRYCYSDISHFNCSTKKRTLYYNSLTCFLYNDINVHRWDGVNSFDVINLRLLKLKQQSWQRIFSLEQIEMWDIIMTVSKPQGTFCINYKKTQMSSSYKEIDTFHI